MRQSGSSDYLSGNRTSDLRMLRTLPSERRAAIGCDAARCGAARRDGARLHPDTTEGETGFTARRIFDSIEKTNIQTFMPVVVALSLTSSLGPSSLIVSVDGRELYSHRR